MAVAVSICENRDLIRKMWGRYLRDERKYDAWGGQGKLLVLREVLAEEGFDIQQLIKIGVQFERLVNLVFPRTFYSAFMKEKMRSVGRSVIDYYTEIKLLISLQETDDLRIYSIAVEETALKFGICSDQLNELLMSGNG